MVAWHLPLLLGHPNFALEPLFVLQYTAFVGASVVFGSVVNFTAGSAFPLMLPHASTNLGPLVTGTGGVFDGSATLPLVVGSGARWLIAITLALLYGRSMYPQTRTNPVR